jgi:hypothetical protein
MSAGIFLGPIVKSSFLEVPYGAKHSLFIYEPLHKYMGRIFHVPRSRTWKLRLAELACERASETSGQVRCPALPAGQFSLPSGQVSAPACQVHNVKFNNAPQLLTPCTHQAPQAHPSYSKIIMFSQKRSKIPPAIQKLVIREECQSSCCSATVDIMAPMKDWFYAIKILHSRRCLL